MGTVSLRQEVAGTLACVVGTNVGSFLDTKSPRLATYRVTSKPFQLFEEDGEEMLDDPTTATFLFTITMHPDLSVEGVTTMEESTKPCCVDAFRAHGFFSSSGLAQLSKIHYDNPLSDTEVFIPMQKHEHVQSLRQRAKLVTAVFDNDSCTELEQPMCRV